ncbi:hypothetical protein CLOBL_54030 [Clostridium sp. BL-8]|nr:hypothetical protein CLOBL_54030 [Clostridium sp. BL-8]
MNKSFNYDNLIKIDSVYETLFEKLENINLANFDLNDYSDTVIQEATLFAIDTFETENKIGNEGEITKELNWQQSLKEKWDIYAERNPIYAFILKIVFTFLISTVFLSPIYNNVETHIKSIFSNINTNNNCDLKSAKKNTNKFLNENYYYLKNEIKIRYRYINQDNISIRNTHKRTSYEMIKVNAGDIIGLLPDNSINKKKRFKNWIYIIYTDSLNQTHIGWVNNLYTERFK